MIEEMQTEIEKRIEEAASEYIKTCKDNMHSVSEAYCKADFKAGAKFILELPELKEVFKALEFYGNEDNWQDPDSYVPYWTLWSDGANVGFNEAQNAISKLKALGIVNG